MYIFGAYDREPLKHAFNQAQFKAGTDAASATLLAMYHQRLTGEGQQVDVSVQEAVATGLRDVVNNFTYTGAVRRRQPNHSGDLSRIRASADGHLLPSPGLAAGLMVGALVILAVQDSIVRLAGADTTLWQFQFIRSCGNLVLLLVLARVIWGTAPKRPKRFWAVARRSLVQRSAVMMF